MKKHEELNHPLSCLSKAHDDELLFILLERDVSAPDAVRAWIESRLRKGKNQWADDQIQEALRWINAVETSLARKAQPKLSDYDRLQAELIRFLREEDYEQASKVRDRIRELEKQGKKQIWPPTPEAPMQGGRAD